MRFRERKERSQRNPIARIIFAYQSTTNFIKDSDGASRCETQKDSGGASRRGNLERLWRIISFISN